MATLPSSTLQLPRPSPTFPSSQQPAAPLRLHAPPRAATEEDSSAPTSSDSAPEQEDSFENRLSQVRLRYRSGTGKKAEIRKTRKGKKLGPGSGSGSGSTVFLPPVPLKESMSEGLAVELGFTPYAERINGRIAIIGLSALLLVELATGQGVINYHSPSIIFIQVYFVVAVSALYIKFEKEKISVWPRSEK